MSKTFEDPYGSARCLSLCHMGRLHVFCSKALRVVYFIAAKKLDAGYACQAKIDLE